MSAVFGELTWGAKRAHHSEDPFLGAPLREMGCHKWIFFRGNSMFKKAGEENWSKPCQTVYIK